MERDLLQIFYDNGTFDLPEDRAASGGPSNRDIAQGRVEDPIGVIRPDSVTEAFSAGLKSGGASLDADVEYFKALFNTATGDQEAAETNVRRARIKEAQAAIPVSTMETFSEFVNEPTIEGFFMQVGKSGGEVFPSLVSTIASGGTGGVAAVLGKAAISKAGKVVANRIVKDALKNTADGTADALEKELAQSVWGVFKAGAFVGAGTSEFVPLAGGNLSEALEVGQELNSDTAMRAAGVALPQALIGVGGEAAMLKLIGNVAKKRAVKEGSLFGRLAKDIGGTALKAGATEGTTEVIQEGIGVANRFDLDDTYTAQDAKMRLGQSAFAGFFAGAGVGGAGGAVSSIFSQANSLVEKGRQAEIDRQINEEQFGDEVLAGFTSEESQSDINGQMEAMTDPSSAKQAVWTAGPSPAYGARENTVTPVEVGESKTQGYAAFVPGRGTIVSTSKQIVEDVIAAGASDTVLQAALGYSGVKTADGDLAVVVTDSQGRVVSEELTTEENRTAAEDAARKLMPQGGSFKTISAQQALEERKSRVEKERGPVVRPMDILDRPLRPEDTVQFNADDAYNAAQKRRLEKTPEIAQTTEAPKGVKDDTGFLAGVYAPVMENEDSKQVNEDMGFRGQATGFDEGGDIFESETTKLKEYAPRNRDKEYENTRPTRDAFEEAFGEEMNIDWESDYYGGMSESLMKAAVAAKKANPDALVTLTEGKDGAYALNLETTPETQTFSIGAQDQKLPIGQFVAQSVKDADRVAKNDDFNNKGAAEAKVTVVDPDGKKTIAILADLVNAGRRIVASREGVNFTQVTDQQAYSAIAGEMLADPDNSYDIQIDGESIFGKTSSGLQIKSMRIRAGGSKAAPVSLQQLNQPKSGSRSTPEIRTYEPVDNTDAPKSLPIRKPIKTDPDKVNTRRLAPPPQTLEKARKAFESSVDIDAKGAWADEYYARMPQALLEQAVLDEGNSNITSEIVIEQDDAGNYTLQTVEKEFEQVAGKTAEEEVAESARSYLGENLIHRLNVEAGPVENRGYAKGKPQNKGGRNPINATYPAGSIGRLATKIASALVKKLRLQKPVSILGIKELSQMTEAKFDEMFSDPRVAAAVREQMNTLLNNSIALGRYMGFNDAHIILVDNRSDNQLQTALTTAHELGHALIQEEMAGSLENSALYRRLVNEFEKARTAKDAPAAYQDPNNELAFEEWYSDQVAIYAKNIYIRKTLPAKNLTASHFKKVADKLVDMFNTMSQEMRRRFGKDAQNQKFTEYMDTLTENKRRYWTAAKNQVGTREATFQQKVLVRAIQDAMPKSKFEGAVETVARLVNEILSNPTVRKASQLIRTEDGVLRTISTKIADMMYIPAQSEGKGSALGFVKAKAAIRKRMMNDAAKILGPDWTTPEATKILELARDYDISTEQLSEYDEAGAGAVKMRAWFNSVYDNYISKTPGNTIGKRDNYFPVALDLAKIADDPEAFVGLMLSKDSQMTGSQIRDTVHKLVQLQKRILSDDEIKVDATDPSAVAEAARVFTSSVSPKELADFSLPPAEALQEYIRDQSTRNEFLRATRAPDGANLLQQELDKLSPVDRKEVVKMLERHMGYSRKPIGPKLRAANSYIQLFQWVTLLPLATISSITELGGAVLNGKDFDAFGLAWKAMKDTIQNPIEAKELAEDLGVTSQRTMENMMMTDADHEYMDPKARVIGDKFFQVIGLDWFTRFTREFAANMGIQFLLRHAVNASGNPRSGRYLKDLGVSAADVKAWEADSRSFDSDSGRRVQDGLTRFVESSMLRPNSAERPSWANDPRLALFWQLKSFLYSFSKTIGGGIMREAKARAAEPGMTGIEKLGGVGLTMALAGVAFMPLAMISLELRELAKYLIAGVLPGVNQSGGRYFRSDRMDWSQYMTEIFDRSGFNGPMSIATSMMHADKWGKTPLAPLLGPTYDLVESAVIDGWKVIPDRVIPVYSIVY